MHLNGVTSMQARARLFVEYHHHLMKKATSTWEMMAMIGGYWGGYGMMKRGMVEWVGMRYAWWMPLAGSELLDVPI